MQSENVSNIGSDTFFDNVTLGNGPGENGPTPLMSYQTRQIILLFNYCVLGHAIGLAGTVANVVNIIVFVKMGFNETINISLLGLAVADLFCLITVQWLFICYNPLLHFNTEVDFVPDDVQYITGGWPHIGFTRVTGIITVYITFERCMCVILPLRVKNIFTPKRTFIVVFFIFILMFGIVVPIFFVINLGWRFDPLANRSRVGLIMKEASIRLPVEGAVFTTNNTVAFITFGLVILFTTVLVVNLKSKARWRESATQVTGKGEEASGNKGSSKERKAVLMVSVISSVFIFCFTPVTLVCIGIMAVPEFNLFGAYHNLNHALMSCGFLLEAINSSINILIYLKMSSKYRSTFNKMFRLKGE